MNGLFTIFIFLIAMSIIEIFYPNISEKLSIKKERRIVFVLVVLVVIVIIAFNLNEELLELF